MIRSLTLCSAVIYMSQEPAGLLEQPRQKREKKRQKEEANQVNQANQANQARDHGGFLGWSQLATDGFKNGLTLTSFCKLNIKVPGRGQGWFRKFWGLVLQRFRRFRWQGTWDGSGWVGRSPLKLGQRPHTVLSPLGRFDLCSPCVHQHDLTCVDEEPEMKFQCVAWICARRSWFLKAVPPRSWERWK